MGMAASQARYLDITARQSDLEYQAQQINQQRSVLSQQCTALFNSLQDINVPTPPSVNDFTTIQYTGSDQVSKFTLGKILPSTAANGTYNVEVLTQTTGDVLSEQYNTAKVTTDSQRPKVIPANTSITLTISDINNYYIKTASGAYIKADAKMDFDYDKTTDRYSFKTGAQYQYFVTDDNTGIEVDYKPTFVAGHEVMTFDDAKALYPSMPWSRYENAITNTFTSGADDPITPDKFKVYFSESSTGVMEPHFVLDTDLLSTETKVYDFSTGQFTKSKMIDECKLEFDSSGRITTLKEPIRDAQDNITGYKILHLTATTVNDDNAYNDAYAKYEYNKFLYDKKQQEINAKTEIIQQQDKNLELKLTRLDNERKQCTTELEAVKKVIEDNIDKSYKTFNG